VRLVANDHWLGVALISPSILLFALLVAYPLVSSVWLSFTSINTITQQGAYVGVANYAALLADSEFYSAVINNFIWTGSSLFFQLSIGIGMALVLHERILFRQAARSLLLFPYLLPTVVVVLVWRWLLNDLYGAINYATVALGGFSVDWLGRIPEAMITVVAIGTWKYFPFVVLAVAARLQTIPEVLYEAARLDGAGAWSRFWDVTFPQLRGVLAAVVLLRAIWDFKEFDLLYMMTGGGPANSTETLPLMVYKAAFGQLAMGRAAATAMAMLGLMLVLMFLYFLGYGRERDEA
jgi:multiple sugar transport system permease protein